MINEPKKKPSLPEKKRKRKNDALSVTLNEGRLARLNPSRKPPVNTHFFGSHAEMTPPSYCSYYPLCLGPSIVLLSVCLLVCLPLSFCLLGVVVAFPEFCFSLFSLLLSFSFLCLLPYIPFCFSLLVF